MVTCRHLHFWSSLGWAGFVRRFRSCVAFLPCLFTGADGRYVGMLPDALNRVSGADGKFTLNKFECSKQAYA